MYIQRHLKSVLEKAGQHFPAVLITGPRQSGKTTFLRQELGDRCAYVSFDDPLQRQFAQADPNGFLNQFADRPVILDEVQYVPALFSHIKMRIDEHRQRNGWWFMTGSQQFQLMKDISDSLAGRIAILELLPFGYGEIRDVSPAPIEDLIWRGGYPALVLDPEARDAWIGSYVQTYIERDVRQLQNVRDLRLFETFLGLCAACHGQIVNHAALSRDCGISQPACKSWEGVLDASFAIRLLQPYYRNFGKRLVKSAKLYFLDSALVAWLTRQPDPAALWSGAMGGAFFEGWVIMEAYKAFAARGERPPLYYWRSHDGQEVDLLIESRGRLHPVEIKKTATPTPHHADALNRYRHTVGESACGDPVVVCCVERRTAMPSGVTALPWHEFDDWLAERM